MDIEKCLTNSESLTRDPLPFLNGDAQVAGQLVDISSALYKLCNEKSKFSSKINALPELHTKQFDDEQIWQQIELFNNSNIITCTRQVHSCNRDAEISLIPVIKQNGDQDASDVSADEESQSDENMEENDPEETAEVDVDAESGVSMEKMEKTEVDDKFFSLRHMEKMLNKQETDNKQDDSDDEIDLFDDIPSTDEEEEFPDVESDQSEDHEVGKDAEVKKSARDVKYDDFFPGFGGNSNKDSNPEIEESFQDEEEEEVEVEVEKKTPHQAQQVKMKKQIKQLESRALEEKDWQMKGETTAEKRPVNSLLEEVLTFDKGERTAPEITDEQTRDVEEIIKQRIKDKSWDDVERKIKEVKNVHEFKKKVVLDSEKSKQSLQDIYEKEYIAKTSGAKEEEKEDPTHVELKSLMKNLFKKLDALSNFHFHASAPTPEIQVVTNLPTIAMEEVQPVSHTDASKLAPEEIHKNTEEKAEEEKTSTDRKRDRRKKKVRQKLRSKARESKLRLLADTNEKLQAVQAIQKLEQSAKMKGSQTTIIKGKKEEGLTSSKAFFSKLEIVNQKQMLKKKST
nr:U3 small nucleolar ribonucleoprotein protein MPP10-like [Ciona intestinalis]XP_026692874.1 U3 small nucleolar ribonucleoprotein protein MPP10-like [Ciona intestinalis]|eukprot:XP_002129730.1 U3 small nucleolar ribonucleoprotein protein MPP10-like [Ciona intestinalis]